MPLPYLSSPDGPRSVRVQFPEPGALHRPSTLRTLPVILVLLLLGAAAPAAGEVLVVTYHPYPDSADPLGFPYAGDRDAFVTRHGFRFDGIPPYPYIVIDGVREVVGIPDPADPMESTRTAILDAVDARSLEPAPVVMSVSTRLAEAGTGEETGMETGDDPTAGSKVAVNVSLMPIEPLGQGVLWVTVLEDPVHFRPPQAVSNGVFDHRNTLRAIQSQEVRLDAASTHKVSLTVGDGWHLDRLLVVAWVQAGADAQRFAAHEVLQAVQAEVGDTNDATERNVLLEMLSATWCDTCLYGDTVAAEIAGLEPSGRRIGYASWPAPAAWLLAAAAAIAIVSWRVRAGGQG